MNKKVLVAYGTKSGSTGEVAKAIGKAFREGGATVDVSPARDATGISEYGAVVVGGPILYGRWHSQAVKFVERHQEELGRIPVAYFITCMELTRVSKEKERGFAIYLDPTLGKPPRAEGKLTFSERGHLLSAFLDPMLRKVPRVKPLSVGVFRGKLDYSRLGFVSWLVMKLIRAREGDFRNWEAIRSWAAGIRPALTETSQEGKQ
jgi:menaquinone-dependent protoporphyrinogen oxidase